MTEDGAKTRWCPLRIVSGPGSDGRLGGCLGSGCAAWRWGEKVRTERLAMDERPKGEGWKDTGETAVFFKASPNPTDECTKRVKIWERSFPKERRGHCGLAGKE